MSASRGKRRGKKKLNPFTLAGVIVLCLVLCGTVTYKTATLKSQSKSYQKQIEQLKEQKSELKDEQAEIKEFKKHAKTDDYVEEIAREKLGLVHKGEIVFKPEK